MGTPNSNLRLEVMSAAAGLQDDESSHRFISSGAPKRRRNVEPPKGKPKLSKTTDAEPTPRPGV